MRATETVPDEALRVGDVVDICGCGARGCLGLLRIVGTRGYEGPLSDVFFGLVDTATGPGFSLTKGGHTARVVGSYDG